jgi:hypothetical protein
MPAPSPIARLTDMIEAVEPIRSEMAGVTLELRWKLYYFLRGIIQRSFCSKGLANQPFK